MIPFSLKRMSTSIPTVTCVLRGGLVAALMGHVPRTGERVQHPSGVELEVIDADLRRVKRLRVRTSGEVAASGT